MNTQQSRDAINREWRDEVEKVEDEFRTAVVRIDRQLRDDLRTLAADITNDWDHLDNPPGFDLAGGGAVWANKALKVGVRIGLSAAGAAAGIAIGTAIGGPPGGVIGGLVGGLASLAAGFFDSIADRFLRSAAEVERRRRAQLREQVAPLLRKIGDRLAAASGEVSDGWATLVADAADEQLGVARSLESAVLQLSKVAIPQINAAVDDLDRHLASALLRYAGRRRAAAAIARATRVRGVGIAVELSEPAFSEMVLFPVAGLVEHIVPTRNDTPPAVGAVQILRAFTDSRVMLSTWRHSDVNAFVEGEEPDGVKRAWGVLAAAHTGACVTIGPSSTAPPTRHP